MNTKKKTKKSKKKSIFETPIKTIGSSVISGGMASKIGSALGYVDKQQIAINNLERIAFALETQTEFAKICFSLIGIMFESKKHEAALKEALGEIEYKKIKQAFKK